MGGIRTWSRQQMVDALAAVNSGMSPAEAARKFKIPESSLSRYRADPTYDQRRRAVPLSEESAKFHPEWSQEECVAELRKVAKEEPTRFISRLYFRNVSDISESTWTRYFGTFQQFRAAAGLTSSRETKRLEKDIAKHSSADKMRQLTLDKAGWEDKYLRPDGKRFKSVLVGSDIHDQECDPFWLRLFIDTARRVQPEAIVLGGDLFDLPEFSRFTQDPREWNPVKRIEWVHQFLAQLREAAPDAEFTLIEGNHEYRLLRHLANQSPEMRAVLSDLHGMTISDLLGLEEYQVNFVARADLAAFRELDITKELRRNYVVLWDQLMVHHYPDARRMGVPGVNGHHHKHVVWPLFSPTFGSYEWHQIGCGHQRQASYTDGERWGNGFALAHLDTAQKFTQIEYIQILDHAVVGGRWYERDDDERV